ncbi:MAG: hypothetical protein L3V56_11705 [Candidatus Magnetoovum sp. WYHC-5]|nr:hypothetical protein [Candidatus Magnetoovum sp. WYHC-5]
MKKTKKKPINKIQPIAEKTPRIASNNSRSSIIDMQPVWRLSKLDFNGDWGWTNIENINTIQRIQYKLSNFESMTWGEIEKNNNNHLIPTEKVSKAAKDRLKEINLDDCSDLYSMRLTGSERLWGIRENEILYILWYDPKHTVYPVPLRNT